MFYKISLIIIAISFFSLNCKGNTDINRKDASTATSPEGKGASTTTSLDKKNNVIDLTETKLEDNLNKPSKEETKKEPKKEVEDIEETF